MKDDKHKQRMQRKKAVVDAAIERADRARGVVVLLTGNGKGKSSSGFGMLARSLGHGLRCGVVQFLKARSDTGEQAFFAGHANCDFHLMGTGFTWETQDRERDIAAAEALWQKAAAMLSDEEYGFVLLDELTYMLSYDYLPAGQVLDAIRSRPVNQHVVVTGRAASQSLIELADTVSEIQDIKHAFRDGVQAMPGVEY